MTVTSVLIIELYKSISVSAVNEHQGECDGRSGRSKRKSF